MQQQDEGGVIINIASVSGMRPSPGTAAYGAAKAGLLSLTQTLAVEWAPKVRVNAVTAGHDPHRAGAPALRRRGGDRRASRATVPLGRLGEPARRRRRLPLPRLAARRATSAAPACCVHGGGERPAFLAAVDPS